ncbi:MAG: hypothetical protein OEY79_00225 [Anaplasmataceae bacterium]|nr:hypothetical protein [Anaplasmataceae bacterium]
MNTQVIQFLNSRRINLTDHIAFNRTDIPKNAIYYLFKSNEVRDANLLTSSLTSKCSLSVHYKSDEISVGGWNASREFSTEQVAEHLMGKGNAIGIRSHALPDNKILCKALKPEVAIKIIKEISNIESKALSSQEIRSLKIRVLKTQLHDNKNLITAIAGNILLASILTICIYFLVKSHSNINNFKQNAQDNFTRYCKIFVQILLIVLAVILCIILNFKTCNKKHNTKIDDPKAIRPHHVETKI